MDKYSSGLVSESFWFIEFKQFVKLRNDGETWEEIKRRCLEENLLGISKEYRVKRIFGYIKNRVEALDADILILFLNSDLATQKLITLIGAAKGNRLFYEFLYEDYREKHIIGVKEITPSDISIFFKRKQDQNDDIAKWTDVTLKRLRSTYMNFLVDAGLITVIEKKKIITPPILDVALENHLNDSGSKNMVKALTGVS